MWPSWPAGGALSQERLTRAKLAADSMSTDFPMPSSDKILTRRSGPGARRGAFRAPGATGEYLLRDGILRLLAIKDSDVRLLTLEQCRDAVDKSLHAGGAFSA